MTSDSVGDFPISTTFEVPGFAIERTVGLCWGLIVRSVGTVKGVTGAFRSMRAGEVPQYTEVVSEARHTALERLVDHAKELGGNVVVGVRFDSSDVGQGLAEIVAYGTAAVARPTS
jgi:uncharacterized protein YbjQ (UPF0145 family)